jgi:DNA-binding transcriptional regulator GbsR (MarR family)
VISYHSPFFFDVLLDLGIKPRNEKWVPSMTTKTRAAPAELKRLADQIGEFIQYWGFKKVHGRIWTHIFLANKPIDAAEIMRRLGVSKALVSMSLSDLMRYDVIEEAGRSERGTLVYKANPDVMNVILNVVRQREKLMFSRIRAAQKNLTALPQKTGSIDSEKLRTLGTFINMGHDALETFLVRGRFDMTGAKKIKFRPNLN